MFLLALVKSPKKKVEINWISIELLPSQYLKQIIPLNVISICAGALFHFENAYLNKHSSSENSNYYNFYLLAKAHTLE